MLPYRLDISVQRPELQVRTQQTFVGIRQQQARFRSEVQPARFYFEKQTPRFTVERSGADEAMHQMSVFDLTDRWCSEAVQISLQGIARIAREGDRMMKIYQRHQTVAAIVSDRFRTSTELNIASVPRPALSWEPGSSQVEWTPYQHNVEWDTPDTVTYNVEPGSVSVRFAPPPRVDIRFIPE